MRLILVLIAVAILGTPPASLKAQDESRGGPDPRADAFKTELLTTQCTRTSRA